MNAKATPFFKTDWMNALEHSIDKDKFNPSWLRKFIEVIIVPVASTIFELLLVSFAAFLPTYLFEIKHPVIIYCQIITVSITVAFFQGCRSWGYASYTKKLVDNYQKLYRLLGAISVIPLNLVILLYFNLYNQNPLIAPTNAKQTQLFAIFLMGLNFAVGIWGSQKQYTTIEQKLARGPMRFFYFSLGLTLAFWFMVFAITSFILK